MVASEGVQRVCIRGLRIVARLQVRAQVCATEAVDGLLGVANHHQRVGLRAGVWRIDAVERAVLPRVGVLKLVHQRHRVLLANGGGQSAIVGHHRVMQVLQQVRKIKRGALCLGGFVGFAHRVCGVQGNVFVGAWLGVKQFNIGLHRCEERKAFSLGPAFVLQGLGGEAL